MRCAEITEATPVAPKKVLKKTAATIKSEKSQYDIALAANVRSFYPVARKLIKDCGTFLNMIDFKVHSFGLYHGTSKNLAGLVTMKCPIERRPRDTEENASEAADQWFLRKFGIRYRSNAMFGTGSPITAGIYGHVYAMFPIGPFNFCYSPEYDDLTDCMDEPVGYADDYIDPDDPDYEMDGDDYLSLISDSVDRILDQGKYQNNTGALGLQNGIHCHHEIMINNAAGAYLYRIDNTKVPTLAYIEQAIIEVRAGKKV